MTLILNVLHRDMSILAADRKAIVEWPTSPARDLNVHVRGNPVARDFNKITLNANKSLALGIAGHTQDHHYVQTIERSASVDDWFFIIRKHMEGVMRVHDRSSLSTLTSFMVNQGIATFFDQGANAYFTNTVLFSPIEIQSRLHRSTEGAKVLHAGSGSEHFEKAVGFEEVESFIASTISSCTLEGCIRWMRDAYRVVSASDPHSGAEAVFMVSTRSDPKFRSVEYC